MKVIAYDPFVKKHDVAEMVKSLDELSPSPTTSASTRRSPTRRKGMMQRTPSRKMKNGVIIVNTGRGKFMVEDDLAEALKAARSAPTPPTSGTSDPPDPAARCSPPRTSS